MNAAVKAFGRGQIIGDIATARLLVNRLPADVVGLKAQLDEATATLRRLNADRASLESTVGPHATATTALVAAIEPAELEAKRIREAFTAANNAQAEALLNAALEGDEQARAEIEALTTDRPDAFPSGFASLVRAAQFDRAVADELAAILADQSESQPRKAG
jgi:hypothetical protein